MLSSIRRAQIIAAACSVGLFGALISGARADAPPCQYSTQSGTVLDHNTKLTWERDPLPDPVKWSDAKARCAILPLDGGRWRMPTIQELQTLIDESKYDPAIDGNAFPNTPADFVWSNTPLAGVAGPVWRVHFYDGLTNTGGMNNMHLVRCVR
jgi:hypothetical protein